MKVELVLRVYKKQGKVKIIITFHTSNMRSLAIVFLVAVSTASASLLGGGVATLVGPVGPAAALKGPSAQATIVGPDGSSISAASDAGALVSAPVAPGVVAAAVAPGHVVAAAPAVLAAPALIGGVGTVIDGPSGIIRTGGNPHGLIAAVPNGLIAPGLVGPGAAIVGPAGLGLGLGLGLGQGIGLGHGLGLGIGPHGVWGR